MPTRMPRRNGTRHPQEMNASGERAELRSAALREPSRKPEPTLTCCQEPMNSASSFRCVFHDVGGRSAPLAAGGEPLQEPEDYEQNGCEHPGLGVGRQ